MILVSASHPIQDCIKFIFNDDWNKVFTLQIKSNGRHAMFIDNKGDVLRLKRVEENVTYFNTKEGGYSVITSIPWEYTGIIPKKNEKTYFYFNIIKYNKRMMCTETIIFDDKSTDW